MLVIRGSCFDSHFEGLELDNLSHYFAEKAAAMAMVISSRDEEWADVREMHQRTVEMCLNSLLLGNPVKLL